MKNNSNKNLPAKDNPKAFIYNHEEKEFEEVDSSNCEDGDKIIDEYLISMLTPEKIYELKTIYNIIDCQGEKGFVLMKDVKQNEKQKISKAINGRINKFIEAEDALRFFSTIQDADEKIDHQAFSMLIAISEKIILNIAQQAYAANETTEGSKNFYEKPVQRGMSSRQLINNFQEGNIRLDFTVTLAKIRDRSLRGEIETYYYFIKELKDDCLDMANNEDTSRLDPRVLLKEVSVKADTILSCTEYLFEKLLTNLEHTAQKLQSFQELGHILADKENNINKIQEENMELTNEINDLKAEIKKKSNLISKFEEQLKKKNEKEISLSSLKTENNELKQQVKRLQSENLKLNSKISLSDSPQTEPSKTIQPPSMEDESKEFIAVNMPTTSLQEYLAAYQEEIEDLKTDLSLKQSLVQAKEDMYEELHNNYKTLSNFVEQLKNENKILMLNIESLQNENEQLKCKSQGGSVFHEPLQISPLASAEQSLGLADSYIEKIKANSNAELNTPSSDQHTPVININLENEFRNQEKKFEVSDLEKKLEKINNISPPTNIFYQNAIEANAIQDYLEQKLTKSSGAILIEDSHKITENSAENQDHIKISDDYQFLMQAKDIFKNISEGLSEIKGISIQLENIRNVLKSSTLKTKSVEEGPRMHIIKNGASYFKALSSTSIDNSLPLVLKKFLPQLEKKDNLHIKSNILSYHPDIDQSAFYKIEEFLKIKEESRDENIVFAEQIHFPSQSKAKENGYLLITSNNLYLIDTSFVCHMEFALDELTQIEASEIKAELLIFKTNLGKNVIVETERRVEAMNFIVQVFKFQNKKSIPIVFFSNTDIDK